MLGIIPWAFIQTGLRESEGEKNVHSALPDESAVVEKNKIIRAVWTKKVFSGAESIASSCFYCTSPLSFFDNTAMISAALVLFGSPLLVTIRTFLFVSKMNPRLNKKSGQQLNSE